VPDRIDAANGSNRDGLNWLTARRFGFFVAALLLAAFPKVLIGLETFYYRDYGVLAYPVIFHEHECSSSPKKRTGAAMPLLFGSIYVLLFRLCHPYC